MARRSPRATTEPFAAAPHALGERRAASRGRYPPTALLRQLGTLALSPDSESPAEAAANTGTSAALRDEQRCRAARPNVAHLSAPPSGSDICVGRVLCGCMVDVAPDSEVVRR